MEFLYKKKCLVLAGGMIIKRMCLLDDLKRHSEI